MSGRGVKRSTFVRSQIDRPEGDLGPPRRPARGVYIRSTLRHFDSKVCRGPKTGPLIPCERRLAEMEFSEFQEVTSWARFENRDYDRPFGEF